MLKFIALFYILLFPGASLAQSAIDELTVDEEQVTQSSNAFPEKIIKISPSGRILIISNNNQSFSQGDFISLALGEKIFARALCAKNTSDNIAGIKILKIFSADLFKTMAPRSDILVIRGDDSFFKKKAEKRVSEKDLSLIQDEDDLYNDTTLLDDELSIEQDKGRLIKNDNLIGFSSGLIAGRDNDGNSQTYIHYSASWARQLTKNIWAEFIGGTNYISDYPTAGLTTQMINFTARAKYTYNAPFYILIQPYVGLQMITASSDGAGAEGDDLTSAQLQEELDALDDLETTGPVFGLTVLKKLVPGWFISMNLGSDLLSLGLSLEF